MCTLCLFHLLLETYNEYHLQADIIRYLPRIVSTLNGQSEQKALVRSVFSSIVTTPPQSFGSVSSNLPRVRQSELLTPAELMVLLHESEKEIGLKPGIEGTCTAITMVPHILNGTS
jgi:symplekin